MDLLFLLVAVAFFFASGVLCVIFERVRGRK